jgi:hypothetical protein
VIVLGVFGLVFALGFLAIVPKTHGVMQRNKRLVATCVAAYLALLFLHPYIVGLPGRIAEMEFGSEVHSGMTEPEIVQLARKYGGRAPFGTVAGESTHELYSGTVIVRFVDVVTLCVEGGNNYTLYFSPDGRLTESKVTRWESAC